jgi:hypothetical protein
MHLQLLKLFASLYKMFKLLNQTKLKPWQHTTATSKYDVLQTPTTVFNPKLNHVKKNLERLTFIALVKME